MVKNMVRGVIKCCSREREHKRMKFVPSGVRVGKSFCKKLLYYGAKLQRAAVSKNKTVWVTTIISFSEFAI